MCLPPGTCAPILWPVARLMPCASDAVAPPAQLEHSRHHQLASEDVEAGSRTSHESFPTVRILNKPNRARRLSLFKSVFGDDS
jgi:hypothetical protein